MSSPPQGSSLASPVHAAAVTGDKATLLRLIGSSPDLIDQEDQLGRTPLMYSVLGDRRACAETLIRAGAQVNRSDRSGRTAVHLAAQTGNHRLLKLLLSRRADCTHRDLRDITALHLSTRHQDTRCLALLLKHTPPGQVDAQDQRKQTALHWSAYYNRPRHVRLLVRHGSNIGIPDQEGKIPLHWAAGHKDPEAALTVRCLLEAAPTESLLNWQDYEGRTPLHLAVGDGNQEVVRLLTSYRGCNVAPYDNLFRTPLHWAALLGHTPIANLLLERNRSPNIPSDSQGATPLHYAAQGNCPDTVRVLLTHLSVRDEADLEGRTAFMWAAGKGSDLALKVMLELDPELELNRTDKYGGTALHAASLSGQISTVRILLDNGAQVDAADVMKHTPLFRACEMGHREVISTLVKGGAKVHLVDKDGRSPLHWAALGGNANVCQILIENKINPNAQDYEGRTPLHCAAYGGYIGCMEVLMENKAEPNIQDKNGRTALHWSCNNGYLDAVKLLLHYNAFPNQMESTEERYTPLDYALLGGHQEVTQFMLEHGALSIAAIQDIAASKIQAVYKGHKVRRAFRDRKNLLMKHEQLRKDAAAKKREGENKRKVRTGQQAKDGQKEVKPVKTAEFQMEGPSGNKEPKEVRAKETSNKTKLKEHQEGSLSPRLREICVEPSRTSPRQSCHSQSTEVQQEGPSGNKEPKEVGAKETSNKTKLKEHQEGSLSPRLREICVVPSRTSPRQSRTSPRQSCHSQSTSPLTPRSEEPHREEDPNKSRDEGKKCRHRREGSNVTTLEKVYGGHKESRRKPHKESREGSGSSPRLENSDKCGGNRHEQEKEASETIHKEEAIQKQIKSTRTHRNKREDLDIVTQKLGAYTITETRSTRRRREAANVIAPTENSYNCVQHGEMLEKPKHQERSCSARTRKRPTTAKLPEEKKPVGREQHSSSGSHSRRMKREDKEEKIVTCSPPSDISFRRSLTVPIPRESSKLGQHATDWQQLDIELIPLEARLQLVEREKARKQLFQRKKQAAIVIQRAWRRYQRKKKHNVKSSLVLRA